MSILRSKVAQVLLAVLLAAPTSLAIASPAHAETNPSCSSVTQIGSTAYVVIGGATFASVKQFKGCSKNWGYLFVWQSWRNSHSSWDMCAAVAVETSDPYLDGIKCFYNTSRAEIWSYGTNTLSLCTRGIGWWPDRASAKTDVRC
ncbi:MAG: hypothetical protein HOV71_10715 [Hamadaea sp.]|nr:hypothetical protein [Hamadaea sp.]NUR48596.1 hypothetical protein [Hamadaea sp.]NUT01871.1 hypothetical protein [Hamadaea sp.]